MLYTLLDKVPPEVRPAVADPQAILRVMYTTLLDWLGRAQEEGQSLMGGNCG
ncbi:hypothetical protein ACFOLD_15185 [Kocuria carniphila]|uniref:hypothetical protein n=1 Tax=Kocuria carniphila TaxID=262208 RepID=UPI00360B0F91